ncbi:mitochondrial import receptor subunit TOM7 homolog [Frieseomelitta varia]|uniref:mitochondrial import receptor subunit TOM7 homolog n=1 Tax=Frieseomelitta varia TaxID=561572 RepID=UPI001CB6A9D7|nr:mitochondrial import receptor subunit TOM7 homolog [Frieseomelitta varia]
MTMTPATKQKIAIILNVSKTVFHWGFIPAILFLGFRKGADPGMPQLSLINLLWQ